MIKNFKIYTNYMDELSREAGVVPLTALFSIIENVLNAARWLHN